MSYLTIGKYAAIVLLGVLLGFLPTRCHYVSELKSVEIAEQNKIIGQLTDALKSNTDQYKANQKLKSDLESLAAKHQTELQGQLDANSALRDDLRVAQRMRLKGTTCPAATTNPFDSSTGIVGDDSGVMLSVETRLAVFDLRSSIIADQQNIVYLRDHIRTVERWIEERYGPEALKEKPPL